MTISGGKGEYKVSMNKIGNNRYVLAKGNDSVIADLSQNILKSV